MGLIMRLSFLLLLSLTFSQANGQYPATGNKMRLGWQTTGDGLIFRGSGNPSYTPNGINSAYTYIDTVSGNVWNRYGGSWHVLATGSGGVVMPFDSVSFSTTYTSQFGTGVMAYDPNNETVSVGIDGGVTLQLGQELLYPIVINKTGTLIKNGTLVMVDTVQLVQGDHVRVRPATNTGFTPSNCIMGVATSDIANDSTGLITWFGYVREVKHADIAETGRTLDAGDILYPSAINAGRYTDTLPTQPAHHTTIALVVRKPTENNMTLLVRPWLAPRLSDLSDVNTSSAGGLSVLRYNTTTKRWEASGTAGIVAADTAAMLSTYLRKLDTASLSNRINLKLNIADTTSMLNAYARGSGTANQIAYWNGTRSLTGSADLVWNNTNDRLNIGGVTDNSNYSLNWDKAADDNFRIKFKNTKSGNSIFTTIQSMNSSGNSLDLQMVSGTYSGSVYLPGEAFVSGNHAPLGLNAGTTAPLTLRFTQNFLERARFTTTGRFAIGSTSADSLLHVQGGATITGGLQVNGSPVMRQADMAPYMLTPTGTGILKSVSGTITYVTDNSNEWNTAYSKRAFGLAFSGTTTKTLTLTLADASALTATFTDNNSGGTVTSVATGWGLTGGTITTTGTIRADSNSVASVYANSLKLNKSDTAAMLAPYAKDTDISGFVSGSGFGSYIPQWSGTNTLSFTNAYYTSNNWGFNTATPQRRVDVNGTVRIRTLVTDTPTRIVGADADGDLNQIKLGAGLVLNTDTLNAVSPAYYFDINLFTPGVAVANTVNSTNFFTVPAGLNGWCIDSYTAKAFSGTGSVDVQIDKNGLAANAQSMSGTTVYTKDTNISLSTGDYIRAQSFNLSGSLTGLGVTIEIKKTCN